MKLDIQFFGGRGASQTKPSRVSSGGTSNVATRTTMMSQEDAEILDGRINPPPSGYFQIGSNGSYTINEALREGNENSLSDAQKRVVATMDKNMKPLDSDIEVVRMADFDYLTSLGISEITADLARKGDSARIERIRNMITGGTVQEKGFMSTSYEKSLKGNAFTYRPVMLNMKVKKGTKAMFSPTGKENEMVLARGTKYKITGVHAITNEAGNKLVLDVETI